MKSIFVSIASYKDPEVLNTVNELLTKQSGENRLRICVFSQIDLQDKTFDSLDEISEVIHIKVDFRTAQGVCWARSHAQKYYNGEDYFMQIDSHIMFAQDWDKKVIEDHELALSYGRKAIITCYPCAYEFNEKGERFIPMESRTVFDMNFKEDDSVPWAIGRFENDTDMPDLQYFIAGGFHFTTGDFVNEVPYDEELFFLGEEITLAIRAYTAGYLIFSPTKFICAHLYQVAQKEREKRPVFWDSNEDKERKIKWGLRNETSMKKVKMVCRGEWHSKYGIQDEFLYKEYAKSVNLMYPELDLSRVRV